MRFLILAVACLLTGCITTNTTHLPPSELLQDCRTGKLSFKDNEATTTSALKLAKALTDCNTDKAGLRAWRKEYE